MFKLKALTLLGAGALLLGVSYLGLFQVPTWLVGVVLLGGGAWVLLGK